MRRAVVGLAVAALLGCAGLPRSGPIRVLLIGDSITEGSVGPGPGRPSGASYAEVLAEELGPDYEVTNAGCGATSSLDWAPSAPFSQCNFARMQLYNARALPRLPSELAVVLLGTNDAVGLREPRPVPVEEYARAIEELARALLDAGVGHVVLMTPPPAWYMAAMQPNRLSGYRDAIHALCGEVSGVVCGPDLFELMDLSEHFPPRDVHPNAAGHRVVAEALARTLRELR